MKSRLLCMCTCLALAVSGLTAARAERPDFQTLSQLRESCQSGWHETVQAFGREITIDLDVAVPDVECFPVMEADPIPLAEGRSSEASVVIGDTEQWMSTGILRIDSPNRQIKNAAQKMHPAPAVLQGYNQYPFSGSLVNLTRTRPMRSTILPPSRTRRRFCFAHGKLSIPARTSRFCPTGSSPIREK